MKAILTILVCTLVPLGALANSYSSADLQDDFERVYHLTGKIHQHALRAGEVMTGAFGPWGKTVHRHSPQELRMIERELRPELDIQAQTKMLQALNQRIFLQLAQPGPQAESLRAELARLLKQKRYRDHRWGFLGVVDLLGLRKSLREAPTAQSLKALSPVLRRESEAAAGEIRFGFLRMIVENTGNRENLIEYFLKETQRPGVELVRESTIRPEDYTTILPDRPTEAGLRQLLEAGGSGLESSEQGFDRDALRQLGSDLVNLVADNLNDDFHEGTAYSRTSGEIIGTVSGMHDALNAAAQQSSVALVNGAVNEALPDPYGILDHYTAGAAGIIGGSMGTFAGWFVSTVETEMAQSERAPGSRSDTTGGTEGTFADFER